MSNYQRGNSNTQIRFYQDQIIQSIQAQDQLYYDNLQNMSNYTKELNRMMKSIIRGVDMSANKILQDVKDNLKAFDNFCDKYNQQYTSVIYNRLIYLKIDPLAIKETKKIFQKRVTCNFGQSQRPGYSNSYFVKLIYLWNQKQMCYNMHAQIWKSQNNQQVTNQTLCQYEKNLMIILTEVLIRKRYVYDFQSNSVTIKSKSINLLIQRKGEEDEDFNVISCIEMQSQKYLKKMVKTLENQETCLYCEKFMMYQDKLGLVMPPTYYFCIIKETIRQNRPQEDQSLRSRQRNRYRRRQNARQITEKLYEQQYRHLHLTCTQKYLKVRNSYDYAKIRRSN